MLKTEIKEEKKKKKKKIHVLPVVGCEGICSLEEKYFAAKEAQAFIQ